jgi:tetratricopeptide (TPR) repeat protein
MFKWLSGGQAAQVGTALADDFILHSESGADARRREGHGSQRQDLQRFLQKFLQRVDRETSALKLNIFRRASLANSFKWRLLEKGVEKTVVDELTQSLVLRLTTGRADAQPGAEPEAEAEASPRGRSESPASMERADGLLARGAYEEAVDCYQELLQRDSRNAVACNNLGNAFWSLGRFGEAEAQYRRAIKMRAKYPEALCNLGTLLRITGRIIESETPLRQALKLKPAHLESQLSLGTTLFFLGRLSEARSLLEKALKLAPRNADALITLGAVAAREGRFEESETMYKRALEIEPKAAAGWAGLAGLRRMTAADGAWLKGAEAATAAGIKPFEESTLRYAIGKYYDDTGDYPRAFRSYQRGNELDKLRAQPYQREAHARFVDDLARIYTRDALAGPHPGASDSEQPVFVVGMPRSGTSLTEQIIASHPAARGAGELSYWNFAVRKHEDALRQALPSEALRQKLAAGYTGVLAQVTNALRVVDKATVNSDYLGLIHAVFPGARIIYMRRDPIDTCLSCYFQQFSAVTSFTLDLSDLAHYYREHQRLIAHWRNALPPGSFLEVPYEGLVADQEKWTRAILEFIGLPWDDRCLKYHLTENTVMTASYWQVRQTIYHSSIGRWRNYQKFIGPLLELKDA